jgi:hypothetical protein
MQPKLVRHVGGLVNLIIGLREQLQRAGFGVVEIHRGPSIACSPSVRQWVRYSIVEILSGAMAQVEPKERDKNDKHWEVGILTMTPTL